MPGHPVTRDTDAGHAAYRPGGSVRGMCLGERQPPEGLPSVPAGGASSGWSSRSMVNSALARAVSHLTALPALVW